MTCASRHAVARSIAVAVGSRREVAPSDPREPPSHGAVCIDGHSVCASRIGIDGPPTRRASCRSRLGLHVSGPRREDAFLCCIALRRSRVLCPYCTPRACHCVQWADCRPWAIRASASHGSQETPTKNASAMATIAVCARYQDAMLHGARSTLSLHARCLLAIVSRFPSGPPSIPSQRSGETSGAPRTREQGLAARSHRADARDSCMPLCWNAGRQQARERAVCLGADPSHWLEGCDRAPTLTSTVDNPPVRHALARGRLGVFAHYSCARATSCVRTLNACFTAARPLAGRLQPQLPRASSPTARLQPTPLGHQSMERRAWSAEHGAPGSPACRRLQQRPRAFQKPALCGLAPR
jgi:hypothetical protein